MKLYTRLLYGIFLFFFILVYVSCKAEMKFDYERILERNYKTNLELIFDPKIDYDMHIADNDPIRKNYHKFKETEINLMNGARMKCYTPSKVKSTLSIDPEKQLMKEIPDEFAFLFLRDSKNICYNNHIKEWFYKLCPTKSANQVLSYKKKNATTGGEYTESWSLGHKESVIFNYTDLYIKETNDTLSHNIPANPFIITDERVRFNI
jgi:hypothetical protein